MIERVDEVVKGFGRLIASFYIPRAAVASAAQCLSDEYGVQAIARARELELDACRRMDMVDHHKWHKVAEFLARPN